MVDDFVGVLQLCQDVEDEHDALSRVGAFVRERLQASSVAFVARESGGVARAGARRLGRSPRVDLRDARRSKPAWRSRRPGAKARSRSACPVRHAAEVIGAVWCRWSAGMPVAAAQAATLLGVARPRPRRRACGSR